MKTIQWDNQPISKPGVYSGVDIDIYHSVGICDGPSVSSSGLRTIFNESPAHFWCASRLNPNAIERKESRHFIVGRAAHHLYLKHIGQQSFTQLFATQPTEYEDEKTGEVKPWNNNANACKRWHALRKEEGKAVLTAAESEQIVGMSLELGKHPIIRAGALNGSIERSIFWKDKATGIWLKSRPDAIPGDSADFVDYKSTTSVLLPDLVRTIGEYGYQMQGALIREAARIVLGISNPTFTLVFQEKTPPYSVRVVTLKDEDLNRGAKQNRRALDTFARCLDAKHWPGPGGDREDAEFVELSDYEQKRIDTALEYPQ